MFIKCQAVVLVTTDATKKAFMKKSGVPVILKDI